MVIVGIDFGTTNSSVAYSRNGKVTVVEIDQSDRSIPSCVAFNKQQRLVGAPAVRQMAKNPQNTVFDIKRLLGCNMGDARRHKKENMLPYELDNAEGKPKIQARYKGNKMTFHPEEIVALILSRLKEITRDYVGETISKAVITVPTSFNALQRRVLIEAASIADVTLLGLVNETTAAAISHGLKNLTDAKRNTLVFHLGGGSFDVALIKIKRDIYDVKAACGNARLGGQNFTNSLVKECIRIFMNKEGIDISGDFRALSRLRFACDKAKADLGLSKSASIKVEALYNGNDFEYTVTEEQFETLNKHVVEEMRENINRVLDEGGISQDKVDDVVAVGAATRMKLVKKLFSEFKFKSLRTINTNEAVATGAAVYAAYLGGEWPDNEFDIRDVLSHKLTIHYKDGVEGVLFKRGRDIPGYTSRPRANSTLDFEIRCTIKPCREKANSLTYGKYSFAVEEGVNTEFVITADGVLEVNMQTIDGKKKIKDTSTKGREGVTTLRRKANDYRQEEDKQKRLQTKLHELEKATYTAKGNLDEAEKISTGKKQDYFAQFDEIIENLEELSNPSENELTAFEVKLNEIRNKISEYEYEIQKHETTVGREETSFSVGERVESQKQSRGPVSNELREKMDELRREVKQVSQKAKMQHDQAALEKCAKIIDSVSETNMTDAKCESLLNELKQIKNVMFLQQRQQVTSGAIAKENANSKTSKGSSLKNYNPGKRENLQAPVRSKSTSKKQHGKTEITSGPIAKENSKRKTSKGISPKSNNPGNHESLLAPVPSNTPNNKEHGKTKGQNIDNPSFSGENPNEDKRKEGCCVIS